MGQSNSKAGKASAPVHDPSRPSLGTPSKTPASQSSNGPPSAAKSTPPAVTNSSAATASAPSRSAATSEIVPDEDPAPAKANGTPPAAARETATPAAAQPVTDTAAKSEAVIPKPSSTAGVASSSGPVAAKELPVQMEGLESHSNISLHTNNPVFEPDNPVFDGEGAEDVRGLKSIEKAGQENKSPNTNAAEKSVKFADKPTSEIQPDKAAAAADAPAQPAAKSAPEAAPEPMAAKVAEAAPPKPSAKPVIAPQPAKETKDVQRPSQYHVSAPQSEKVRSGGCFSCFSPKVKHEAPKHEPGRPSIGTPTNFQPKYKTDIPPPPLATSTDGDKTASKAKAAESTPVTESAAAKDKSSETPKAEVTKSGAEKEIGEPTAAATAAAGVPGVVMVNNAAAKPSTATSEPEAGAQSSPSKGVQVEYGEPHSTTEKPFIASPNASSPVVQETFGNPDQGLSAGKAAELHDAVAQDHPPKTAPILSEDGVPLAAVAPEVAEVAAEKLEEAHPGESYETTAVAPEPPLQTTDPRVEADKIDAEAPKTVSTHTYESSSTSQETHTHKTVPEAGALPALSEPANGMGANKGTAVAAHPVGIEEDLHSLGSQPKQADSALPVKEDILSHDALRDAEVEGRGTAEKAPFADAEPISVKDTASASAVTEQPDKDIDFTDALDDSEPEDTEGHDYLAHDGSGGNATVLRESGEVIPGGSGTGHAKEKPIDADTGMTRVSDPPASFAAAAETTPAKDMSAAPEVTSGAAPEAEPKGVSENGIAEATTAGAAAGTGGAAVAAAAVPERQLSKKELKAEEKLAKQESTRKVMEEKTAAKSKELEAKQAQKLQKRREKEEKAREKLRQKSSKRKSGFLGLFGSSKGLAAGGDAAAAAGGAAGSAANTGGAAAAGTASATPEAAGTATAAAPAPATGGANIAAPVAAGVGAGTVAGVAAGTVTSQSHTPSATEAAAPVVATLPPVTREVTEAPGKDAAVVAPTFAAVAPAVTPLDTSEAALDSPKATTTAVQAPLTPEPAAAPPSSYSPLTAAHPDTSVEPATTPETYDQAATQQADGEPVWPQKRARKSFKKVPKVDHSANFMSRTPGYKPEYLQNARAPPGAYSPMSGGKPALQNSVSLVKQKSLQRNPSAAGAAPGLASQSSIHSLNSFDLGGRAKAHMGRGVNRPEVSITKNYSPFRTALGHRDA